MCVWFNVNLFGEIKNAVCREFIQISRPMRNTQNKDRQKNSSGIIIAGNKTSRLKLILHYKVREHAAHQQNDERIICQYILIQI